MTVERDGAVVATAHFLDDRAAVIPTKLDSGSEVVLSDFLDDGQREAWFEQLIGQAAGDAPDAEDISQLDTSVAALGELLALVAEDDEAGFDAFCGTRSWLVGGLSPSQGWPPARVHQVVSRADLLSFVCDRVDLRLIR